MQKSGGATQSFALPLQPSAFRLLPSALCPLPSAFCPLPSASPLRRRLLRDFHRQHGAFGTVALVIPAKHFVMMIAQAG